MDKRVTLFKNIKSTFNIENTVYPELTRIRGLGKSSLVEMLRVLKIPSNKKIIELSIEEKSKIENQLNEKTIEEKRKNQISQYIYLEQAIKSTRGFRHLHKLKLRGQKTKSTGRKSKKTRVKKK